MCTFVTPTAFLTQPAQSPKVQSLLPPSLLTCSRLHLSNPAQCTAGAYNSALKLGPPGKVVGSLRLAMKLLGRHSGELPQPQCRSEGARAQKLCFRGVPHWEEDARSCCPCCVWSLTLGCQRRTWPWLQHCGCMWRLCMYCLVVTSLSLF